MWACRREGLPDPSDPPPTIRHAVSSIQPSLAAQTQEALAQGVKSAAPCGERAQTNIWQNKAGFPYAGFCQEVVSGQAVQARLHRSAFPGLVSLEFFYAAAKREQLEEHREAKSSVFLPGWEVLKGCQCSDELDVHNGSGIRVMIPLCGHFLTYHT